MAMITRYVDPDSTTGGDGTTNALTGDNRAYVSLNAWEAAQQQDLTDSGGDIAECICDSNGPAHTADVAALSVYGWTTNTACYIWIHTPAASRHSGTWDAAKYNLTVPNAVVLTLQEENIRIDGLEISKSSSNNHNQYLIYISSLVAGGRIDLSNLVLEQAGNGSYAECGIYCNDPDAVVNAWNLILYGCSAYNSSSSFALINNSGVFNLYSSTVVGGRGGVKNAGTMTAKNVYASGGAGASYNGTIGMTTCASADATGSAGLQNIAVNITNFTNVFAGTENFHLPLGSGLIDVGTDTSGDAAPLNFTTDIDAETRSGTWDVGADEYISAGARSGTLDKILADLSVSSAGAVLTQGVFAKTFDGISASSSGAVLIQGSAARNLADVIPSAAGAVLVQGQLAKTFADVALVATGIGQVSTQGTLAATLGSLGISAAGVVPLVGQLAKVLADAVGTGTGTVYVSGVLAQTLADVLPSATGKILVVGQAAAGLADLQLVASGNATGEILGELIVLLEDLFARGRGTEHVEPTPAERTIIVAYENRAIVVAFEDRAIVVPFENRTVRIE